MIPVRHRPVLVRALTRRSAATRLIWREGDVCLTGAHVPGFRNAPMFDPLPGAPDRIVRLTAELDDAVRATCLAEPTTVWRGMLSSSLVAALGPGLVGADLRDVAFVSATPDRARIERLLGARADAILIEIAASAGTPVAPIAWMMRGAVPHELLFARGTCLRIVHADAPERRIVVSVVVE